jgi:hypothetical protein
MPYTLYYLCKKKPIYYSRRIFFILIGGYSALLITSVNFNEPTLGCPFLLNNSPSLTYFVFKPVIFSKAATDLTLFHDKKDKNKVSEII